MNHNGIEKINKAIHILREGGMVVIQDSQDRENEADLVTAAEYINTEKMAFIIRHTSGIVCVPMAPEYLDKIGIPLMVTTDNNTSCVQTNFTLPVDLKRCNHTGVSAEDRMLTAKKLADPQAQLTDFVIPGHVYPLRAVPEGVLKRQGHTEASVDLLKIAGLQPVAVISELMNDDGSIMRNDSLSEFLKKHKLFSIHIQEIIFYLTNKKD